ncbi:hypothetical protein [Nitrospira sp. Kam-Ns4a]
MRKAERGASVREIHPHPLSPSPLFPALDALLLLFILNLVLQPLFEPDFGWHLRAGLDLLANGWRMPATDPYSHTVPDWPWVEHAWLTDGLLGLIYRGLGPVGPLGVILFFGAVTAGAFGLVMVGARAGHTARLIALAGALWAALPFLGARTQMVTLLGMAVLLQLWRVYQAGRRSHLWVVPPLFLLWANLHGGFTAGLFALALILIVSASVRLAANRWPALASRLDEPVLAWPQLGHLARVGVVAALVTLINPYGWRLHEEIALSLSDQFMIEMLHEWQPVSLATKAGATYLGYLAVVALSCLLGYRRVEPVRWAILAVFLLLSLRHWRNVLLFLLLSAPLVAEAFSGVALQARARFAAAATVRRRKLAQFAVSLAVAAGMWLLGPEHLVHVVQCGLHPAEYFRQTEYPIEAIQWVRANRHRLGVRLYNDYGYGGFLLWWLPEEKIFIDGRMPAWRVGDRWIFRDYMALAGAASPDLRVLDKYRVDWALVGRGTPLDGALVQAPGWREVYGDAKVRIFVRFKA